MVAAGFLVACSTSTPDQPATSTSVTPTGHGTLAHCLGEHRVPTAPGPAVGSPPGVDPATWQQAMQACSSLALGLGRPASSAETELVHEDSPENDQ
jgi:hypothetical protein